MLDGAGKPAGERNVDQSVNFGVIRNTYSIHSKFSENTQAEKVVDRSGKPEERDSSNAQIRTLLEEQRQMIIAEHCEKIGHHELQAAHAEEERRILREELWRQRSGNSHVTSRPVSFPPHPIPEGLLRPSFVSPCRKEGPPSFGTHMVYRETFLQIHMHLHQLLILKN